MALIKTGGGVAEIRGAIGGTVYSRNRYGAYARNKSIPINPNTEAQSEVRSIMSILQTLWAALSVEQRDSWNNYAANVPVVNRLGDTINLSGWNHYCRSNFIRLLQTEPVVYTAPTYYALPPADLDVIPTVSAATSLITVAFDEGAAWADQNGAFLVVYESISYRRAVSYPPNIVRIIGKISGSASSPPESPLTFTTWEGLGNLTAGNYKRINFRVCMGDGATSEIWQNQITIG